MADSPGARRTECPIRFFFFSLLCLPARWMLLAIGANVVKPFQLTNVPIIAGLALVERRHGQAAEALALWSLQNRAYALMISRVSAEQLIGGYRGDPGKSPQDSTIRGLAVTACSASITLAPCGWRIIRAAGYSCMHLKPSVIFLWEMYPHLYNPDPDIVFERDGTAGLKVTPTERRLFYVTGHMH